jgi:hypothetical protein
MLMGHARRVRGAGVWGTVGSAETAPNDRFPSGKWQSFRKSSRFAMPPDMRWIIVKNNFFATQ